MRLALEQVGQAQLEDGARLDAGGHVDDHHLCLRRDPQEVVHVELPDGPDADIGRQRGLHRLAGGRGGAVIAPVGRAADEDLDRGGRPRHPTSSMCSWRKWVAQLMHGS